VQVVDFSLRGEWMAVHSPGSRIPSHGTDILAQRYAFDLIRFDPERHGRYHPVRELALVLRTAVTFRPTPEGLHRVLGNHVILRCDGAYAGFAHLTTGSLSVAPGQAVRRGDVLGRVGHTGNSTAPHLHFQLMDGPDVVTARGVPCVFRAYETFHDGAWTLVERSVPTSTERIRSVAD
jgi:hypothetical protein